MSIEFIILVMAALATATFVLVLLLIKHLKLDKLLIPFWFLIICVYYIFITLKILSFYGYINV